MATGNGNQKIIKGLSQEFLSPNEIKFIDDLFETGMQNVWKSYMRAYGCSENVAKKGAYKSLKKERVMSEIQARVEASGITKDWVRMKAKEYVENGLENADYALPGVKSNEMLAKSLGMLEDTVNHRFGEHNPAVFVPAYTEEEKKELEQAKRIEE